MHKRTILAVDSDPAELRFIEHALVGHGFGVERAASADEAIKIIRENDPSHFSCVVANYDLPEKNGLELLSWIKSVDNALSLIITSAKARPEVLQAALRQGASDLLEKPLAADTTRVAVEKACEKTLQLRRLHTAEKNIRAVARTNNLFKSILVPELAPQIQVHHTPFDQVGGDFINVLPINDQKSLLLLGDVSGHDLRAGFVSAYFQGLVRGVCRSGHSIVEASNAFNEILLKEWQRRGETTGLIKIEPRTSLSLLAVELDLEKNCALIVNCGAPTLCIADKNGTARNIPSENMPLGWSNAEPIKSVEISLDNIAYLFLATDGLQDWAAMLGQSPLGLTYRLLQKRNSPGGTPPDDLLVLRYQHAKEIPPEELWHPLGCVEGETDGNKKTTAEMTSELYDLMRMNSRTVTDTHAALTPELLHSSLAHYSKPVAQFSLAVRPRDEALKIITRFADESVEEVEI